MKRFISIALIATSINAYAEWQRVDSEAMNPKANKTWCRNSGAHTPACAHHNTKNKRDRVLRNTKTGQLFNCGALGDDIVPGCGRPYKLENNK